MSPADIIPMAEPFGGPQLQDRETAIRQVADTLHRLNVQIVHAVDAGATIELMRTGRHHNGKGAWGDQMVPIVRVKEGG